MVFAICLSLRRLVRAAATAAFTRTGLHSSSERCEPTQPGVVQPKLALGIHKRCRNTPLSYTIGVSHTNTQLWGWTEFGTRQGVGGIWDPPGRTYRQNSDSDVLAPWRQLNSGSLRSDVWAPSDVWVTREHLHGTTSGSSNRNARGGECHGRQNDDRSAMGSAPTDPQL
jgi:hypothetical protein